MVQELVKVTVKEWMHQIRSNAYLKTILVVGLVGFLAASAWYGNKWYVYRAQTSAQMAFSNAYEEYSKGLHLTHRSDPKNDKAAQQFDDAYALFDMVKDQHKGTVYADYAQAFQADIVLLKGDSQKAVQLFEAFVKNIDQTNPFYYLYKTKIALIKLDLQDVGGIDELEALVKDEKNVMVDMSAYFLGYYYWVHNKLEDAKRVWAKVTTPQKDAATQVVSPWVQMVQLKLSHVS